MCGWSSKAGCSPAFRSTGSQQGAKCTCSNATHRSPLSSCSSNETFPSRWNLEPVLVKVSGGEIHLYSSISCSKSVWSVPRAQNQSSSFTWAPAATNSLTNSLKNKVRKKSNECVNVVWSQVCNCFHTYLYGLSGVWNKAKESGEWKPRVFVQSCASGLKPSLKSTCTLSFWCLLTATYIGLTIPSPWSHTRSVTGISFFRILDFGKKKRQKTCG